MDLAFVEVLRRLGKEVGQVDFEVILVVECFLAQVIRKRTKQMIICWDQIRKVK